MTTSISDVLIIEREMFDDDRCYFYESFNEREFAQRIGSDSTPCFVQDNRSISVKNALPGLHYQIQHPQGKLMPVIATPLTLNTTQNYALQGQAIPGSHVNLLIRTFFRLPGRELTLKLSQG